MEQKLTYQLGETVFDLSRGTLHRGDRLIMLRHKTFELLAYLARNAGRVVTKDELLEAVWPQSVVTEDSLTQCIRDARKSIGDEEQAIIRTVPRRGYLFQPTTGVAEVAQALAHPPAEIDLPPAEPRVAVFPFRVAVADEAVRPIFDGVVEEITTALSYFKTIGVLGRFSALALAQTPPQEMQDALTDAGVEYIVEGQVEGGDPLFSVTITLSGTRSGRRLWTQSFSFEAEGIFAFHQTVAQQVASVLVFNIESHATQRMPPAPANNVEAYILMMRGVMLLRSYGEDFYEQGRELLLKAVALDPQSGMALSYLALAEAVEKGSYGTRASDRLDRALESALRAIVLSPTQARCHRVLAIILLFRHDFAHAEAHYRQALELNPYDADTIAQMGWLKAIRGNAAEGLRWLDKAIQLNPIHPPWYYFDRGTALLLLGRYLEAVQCFACMPPRDVNRWALLSICHILDGDAEQAAACVLQARELEPGLTIEVIQHVIILEQESDRTRIRAALLDAGWTSGEVG